MVSRSSRSSQGTYLMACVNERIGLSFGNGIASALNAALDSGRWYAP